MEIRHIPMIISVSSGLSSAVAGERVLKEYDAIPVFMDTIMEDDDNYRFLNELEMRWNRLYGVDIVRLSMGIDPYQVASQENMIFNQRRHPCTRILKIEPFMKWLKENHQYAIINIGIDYSEVDRCKAIEENYKAAGYSVDFPLLWKPYEFRPYTQVCREDWGIEPPKMYAMGYSHANCGGRCFAQGWGDWIHTLINFPDRYNQSEEWEQEMRKRPGLENYAICRDQAGKQVKPLTLRELRKRYESGLIGGLPMQKSLVCIRCGVGDFISPQEE